MNKKRKLIETDELTRRDVEDIAYQSVLKILKNDTKAEDIIIGMVRNGLIQMYKTMYTRRGFWKDDIRNRAI
jgi:hypothetical protein